MEVSAPPSTTAPSASARQDSPDQTAKSTLTSVPLSPATTAEAAWTCRKDTGTVVPGFRVLGFSALPGFKAIKAGDGAWSVHKTLFGFRAPLFWPFLFPKLG